MVEFVANTICRFILLVKLWKRRYKEHSPHINTSQVEYKIVKGKNAPQIQRLATKSTSTKCQKQTQHKKNEEIKFASWKHWKRKFFHVN